MSDTFLIAVSFFTSMFTAILGMGGGTLLIAAMPGLLPAPAIVPVHGIVQLASNASRAAFGWRHVGWRYVWPFVCGALLGVALGSQIVPKVRWDYLPTLLGVSILLFTWAPKAARMPELPGKFVILGAVQTFLSLFIGIAGPLSMPFLLREGLSRDRVVVTQAMLSSATHALKVITFGFLGFAFLPYLYLIAGMILSTTAGSFAGTRLRAHLPEVLFRKIFKLLITALALRMILRVAI